MNNDMKQRIMNEIEKNVPIFHKVSHIQYRIRCPFCGDSQSNTRDSHMYIKCDYYDTESPIVYNCFKGNCNARGVLGKEFLDKLGIKIDGIESFENRILNKITSIKKTNVNVITGNPIIPSHQVKYIESRLGNGFTSEDYDRFKIIWNMDTLHEHITDVRVKNTLPSNQNSISFLSDDKSLLLTRFFGDDEPRWKKSRLFPSPNKSYYTVKSTIDLFTKDHIEIHIAEGVFDILSVYKNFTNGSDSIYIAVLGSDYESALSYVIENGYIGGNVILKFYLDSDIQEKIIINKFKKYKWLFSKIVIYHNIKDNDFGVPIDKIQYVEVTV